MDQVINFILPLVQTYIVPLVAKYPIAASILLVMGSARAVFKPIMAALHAYVESTPKTSDDEAIAKVEASKFFKAFAFVLDYVGSIKIGPAKEPVK
jgi:hypothetical protein